MPTLKLIGHTVKEILELSVKSPILADAKSKIFCKQYENLKNSGFGAKFLKVLSKEHGLKTDKIFSTVNVLFALRSYFKLILKQLVQRFHLWLT